ncbi:hypothetical protein [Halorubellus litoreus]|uniref:Uncharacterized protein n=1 Tax=Halorubellus litoreus TaxID=755308 RepID=A0ABD5VII0_9EURY
MSTNLNTRTISETSDKITTEEYAKTTPAAVLTVIETNVGDLTVPEWYIPTTKAVYDKQGVVESWAQKKFPVHTVSLCPDSDDSVFRSKLRNTSKNQTAYQYTDGTGICYHYSTICGIRTKSGLVFNNQQNYASGRVTLYSVPHRFSDGNLPLTTLREIVRGTDVDLFDITEVIEGKNAELVVFGSGREVVAIGYDATAAQGNGEFAFLLTEDEQEMVRREPDRIYDILMPVEVARFLNDGVKLNENPRIYGHKADGETIMRQGEHFFVPYPDFEYRYADTVVGDRANPDGLEKPQTNKVRYGRRYRAHHDLGSHIPRDYIQLTDGRRFVRGTIRHLRREHRMLNLGETWHEVFTNDREVTVIGDRSTLSD